MVQPSPPEFELALVGIGEKLLLIATRFGDTLDSIDITSKYDGTAFYYSKVHYIPEQNGDLLIMFECHYGGDASRSEDRLIIFRYSNEKLNKVANYNLQNSPNIKYRDGYLASIMGESRFTFEDFYYEEDTQRNFAIPVTIKYDNGRFNIICRLSKKEREDVTKRFKLEMKKEVDNDYNGKQPVYLQELETEFMNTVRVCVDDLNLIS